MSGWTPQAITSLIVGITGLVSAIGVALAHLNLRKKVAANVQPGPPAPPQP